MTFRNEREREIYATEFAQLHGSDAIEREMRAEAAVDLDRRLRSGEFRKQNNGGKVDMRGRCRRRVAKQAKNASDLLRTCLDECRRRYGVEVVSWSMAGHSESMFQAKRFTTAALLEAMGRGQTAKAIGIDPCSVDYWTRKYAGHQSDAISGEKFGATLVVEWESVVVEPKQESEAA